MGTWFNYVIIGPELEEANISYSIDDPIRPVPLEERAAFIAKVNADLEGKLFDSKGNPKQKYYGDYYGYYPLGRHEFYDVNGNEIVGIKLAGDTYVAYISDQTNYVGITLEEAISFVGAEMKLPNYGSYLLTNIIVAVHTESTVAYFNYENESSRFVIYCDRVTNNSTATSFYFTKEPVTLYAGDIEVFKFYTSSDCTGFYRWKMDDIVYGFVASQISGDDEMIAIIESMQ